MNIGIINFEMAPAGVNQLLHKVISELLQAHTVTGIRLDAQTGLLTYKDYEEENVAGTFVDFRNLLQLSPLTEDITVFDTLADFDAILVIGPQQAEAFVRALNERLDRTNCLFIPVSIYRNVVETDQSLGYDTAINYVIDSILRIRDTIDSLKYPNPRLLGVQMEGNVPHQALDEMAVAIGGHVLNHDFDEQEVDGLKKALRKEFASGQTYAFLLFDERIDAKRIPGELLTDIAIDWKTHKIDESLCMGPEPTAADRILAMKMAGGIVDWLRNSQSSGKLLVKSRKAKVELY
ncbi:6-phosphofructokinase [Sediminibacillus halophilus]|uniref:Phosphofructokinase n=1 Tax=Sediminibacillus halophilus TaxID=482461 RepID=A0A1G9RWI8_9BACI|nr:6-phosphofructokinase [Sediminibacillus halophilus]SDM27524.1 Phosphofructokinase [Sediminibacillus halophilus]